MCHDGDYGPFTSFASGGHYQCYWYALVRLWVIHHHDVANWNTPVGGDVHVHLASDLHTQSIPVHTRGMASVSSAVLWEVI